MAKSSLSALIRAGNGEGDRGRVTGEGERGRVTGEGERGWVTGEGERGRVRGHIQTICEKINVIMTLTPHPPPPPPPLSVIQNNHLYEGRKASKLYSPQGLNPYNTITYIFLLNSCLNIARSANSK